MAAITYGDVRLPAPAPVFKSGRAKTKGLFARFMDALIESRLEAARREISLHRTLLPYTFDERSNRLVKLGHDAMPFGG